MHECPCINYNFNIGIDAMHLMTLPYSHRLRLSLCMNVVASGSLVLLFLLQADRHLSLSSTQGLRMQTETVRLCSYASHKLRIAIGCQLNNS